MVNAPKVGMSGLMKMPEAKILVKMFVDGMRKSPTFAFHKYPSKAGYKSSDLLEINHRRFTFRNELTL